MLSNCFNSLVGSWTYPVKRNAEAEKFNASHFNSHVAIYDVPVGKLTVKKATAKINEKAKNSAVLNGDEVILKKNSDKVITNKKSSLTLKSNILAILVVKSGTFRILSS